MYFKIAFQIQAQIFQIMSFFLPTFSLTSNNWKTFKDRELSHVRKNGHCVNISCREEKQIRLVIYVIFP